MARERLSRRAIALGTAGAFGAVAMLAACGSEQHTPLTGQAQGIMRLYKAHPEQGTIDDKPPHTLQVKAAGRAGAVVTLSYQSSTEREGVPNPSSAVALDIGVNNHGHQTAMSLLLTTENNTIVTAHTAQGQVSASGNMAQYRDVGGPDVPDLARCVQQGMTDQARAIVANPASVTAIVPPVC